MITFDAIFVPKSDTKNSYFLVTPQTYESITGYSPITYNEFFCIFEPQIIPNGEQYFHQNKIFTDKVEMYTYELIFSANIDPSQSFDIEKMILTLEKENRIKHINIALNKRKNSKK